MSDTRHFIRGAGATLLIAGLAGAGCSNVIPMAADHGPIPLDSARAVAIAQRNVCGPPAAVAEGTCILRGYQRSADRFVIILDRRPPAGNDRVAVTLRDHGMRVEVAEVPGAPR